MTAEQTLLSFKAKIADFFVVAVVCFPVAGLLFLLVKDVNKGGVAGLNLICIVGGGALCIVGFISIGIALRQFVLAPTVIVGEDYIAIRLRSSEIFRWPIASITRDKWGFLFNSEGSGTLWSDLYQAIKQKGLYITLGQHSIFFERYATGLWRALRDRMPDQVPVGFVHAKNAEASVGLFFLWVDEQQCFLGRNAMTNHLERSTPSCTIENPLVMLRADGAKQLFLTILRKCNVDGTDSATSESFNVTPDSILDHDSRLEYNVSDHPFRLEGWVISSKRFDDSGTPAGCAP